MSIYLVYFNQESKKTQGFTGGSVVKNPPANAGDAKFVAWIPGWGRSLGVEMTPHSRIPAWEIPWTGEHGRLQSTGSQSIGHN